MYENQKKPRSKLLVLSVILFAVGIVSSVIFGIMLAKSISAPRYYLTAPAPCEIAVETGGKYEIYYEYLGRYQLDESVVFTFEHADTGEVSTSYATSMNSSYNVNGTNGQLIGMVVLDQPGTYHVTSSYTPTKEPLQFLIGQGVVTGLLIPIFGIIFLGAFAIVGGIITLVLGKHKTKRMQQPMPFEKPFE